MKELDRVHNHVLNQILGRQRPGGDAGQPAGGDIERVTRLDRAVRQSVGDLYMALTELNRPDMAIDMLAEHVAMMVEMINEQKASLRK
jgi:hypothetical protein